MHHLNQLSISIVLLCIVACGAFGDCLHSDGSNACDVGPIMHHELTGEDGTGLYCTERYDLCLTVQRMVDPHPWGDTGDDSSIYEWSGGALQCREAGVLTGGLEFSPRTTCLEIAPDPVLYSASADWTPDGIRMFVDGRAEPIELIRQ